MAVNHTNNGEDALTLEVLEEPLVLSHHDLQDTHPKSVLPVVTVICDLVLTRPVLLSEVILEALGDLRKPNRLESKLGERQQPCKVHQVQPVYLLRRGDSLDLGVFLLDLKRHLPIYVAPDHLFSSLRCHNQSVRLTNRL